MLTDAEREAVHALLVQRRPRRVLEWGGGGSTLHWPALFPEIDWWTVEHNPQYYAKLQAQIPPNVTLRLLAFPAYHELNVDDVGRFDVIFVDVRQRVACMAAARELLAPGGIVLLHDASRARYHPAWLYYHTAQEVVPPDPARGRDPRGLMLFAEPRIVAPRPGCGVVYMAWGTNALYQTAASLRSLWAIAPELPALVVGDTHAAAHFSTWSNVTALALPLDPFDERQACGHKFLAGRVKPWLHVLAPWERVLYVDADTQFVAHPRRGFDLLDAWDFVLAEARSGSVENSPFLKPERQATAEWLGTGLHLYHNSGMLFWRRGPAVAGLMRLWSEEWLRYSDWDEQIALLRALLRSEALFLTVPYTWNTLENATLLQHAYGTRIARREESRAQRVARGKARLTPDQQPGG